MRERSGGIRTKQWPRCDLSFEGAEGVEDHREVDRLLEQRARQLPEPGALHLTRASDLLELDMPEPDLSVYQPKDDDSQSQGTV